MTSQTVTGFNGRTIRVFQPSTEFLTEWQVRVDGVVTRSFAANEQDQMSRYVAAERAMGRKVTVGSSNGF